MTRPQYLVMPSAIEIDGYWTIPCHCCGVVLYFPSAPTSEILTCISAQCQEWAVTLEGMWNEVTNHTTE